MNKNTFTTVKLTKGEMNIYDFGSVKLHAYKTNDFLDDEVFVVEKNGKAVVIESPCFLIIAKSSNDISRILRLKACLSRITVQVRHSCRRFRNMLRKMPWTILKTAEAGH